MSAADIHVPACALSSQQVEHWLRRAKPGQFLQYHQGLLIVDRSADGLATPQQRSASDRIHRIANLLWQAGQDGLVRLFSLKLEDGFYRYVAQRTERPMRMEVPV